MSGSVAAEEAFAARLSALCAETIPLPAGGHSAERHARLVAVGREDVSLAKLVEAHWDAMAILAEAGREPLPGRIYGVWASEAPGTNLELRRAEDDSPGQACALWGTKRFASGAGLVDRTLLTTGGAASQLVEVDLRAEAGTIAIDGSGWQTEAFRLTRTSTVTFEGSRLEPDAVLGGANWYVERPGFWHGACGPAACWAGGVLGLVDYARRSSRTDAHTLAHLGAMEANCWGMQAVLAEAGRAMDAEPHDAAAAHRRALTVRHLVEQLAADVLMRFTRAYGPAPLAFDAAIARRVQEATLYLRQCHGERDLEQLGRSLQPARPAGGASEKE